jgi:hypothetical protein
MWSAFSLLLRLGWVEFRHASRSQAAGAAGAVSGARGGVDQAYDGRREVSQFEFQQWVESGYSIKPPA